MAIAFTKTAIQLKLPNKKLVSNWIKEVIVKEGLVCGTISFTFMSDEELLDINREFLEHDQYTDIITFDYSEENKVSGDIYISHERVTENAERFKSSFEKELHRVMIHGILHLCGYVDKTNLQKQEMREKEDHYLKKLKGLSPF